MIFAVTLLNAVIGYVQESKAENAIAALAQSVTTAATVIRGGQKQRINSRELVPGDVVLLTSGDKVPAIGVLGVFIFQVLFSQVSFVNPLFDTQPLTLNQALLGIAAGVPIMVPALMLRRLAPLG